MVDERKNLFIEEVERLFNENEVCEDARDFFDDYKKGHTSNKKVMTDKGFKILKAIYEMSEGAEENVYTAKQIGEYLDVSGRSASGTLRKLVEDGYVVKYDGKPSCYGIADKGAAFIVDNPDFIIEENIEEI